MKRGTPRHPKMYALAEALKIRLPEAVGILEMLWHHANQHTPRGNIGSIPDRAIAECVGWKRSPQSLIDGLVASKWIDKNQEHRLILHDWPDHCEQSSIKWLEYNRLDFLPIYGVSLEKRKRSASNSLPSRVARQGKAVLKANSTEETSTREAFSFEDAVRELQSVYPKKARRGLVDGERWYIEKLTAAGDAEAFHADVMDRVRRLWVPSRLWAGGYVKNFDDFVRNERWREEPEPSEEIPVAKRVMM
jgi:hypothetical protein